MENWQNQELHDQLMVNAQLQEDKTIFEMMKPRLEIDGNQWCCIWGIMPENYIAGFGDSPCKAISDFCRAWRSPLIINKIN